MSIIKPSKNTGNTIASLAVDKGIVTIIFEDGEKIKISEETYLSSPYLYAGKYLEQSEIEKLSQGEDQRKYLSYLYKISSMRLYSKKQLIDKLIQTKQLDYQDALEVFDEFERLGGYSSAFYLTNIITSYLDKYYASSKIVELLVEEGFKEDDIIKELDSKKDEVKDPNDLIEYYFKKYSNKSLFNISKTIEIKMNPLGYSSSEVHTLISHYKEQISPEVIQSQEKEKMLKIADSVYSSITKGDKFEKKNKFIAKMQYRGFSYDKILEVWKKRKYEQ